MSWYYSDSGKQAGPVDQPAFDELVKLGRIGPETLVWQEGMANWLPYKTIGGSPAVPIAAGAQAACSECGQVFPGEDLVQIGGALVCASCKPLAVQKLKEGVDLPGEFRYAGFWIRFVGKFVDGLILGAVQAFFNMACVLMLHPYSATGTDANVNVQVILVTVLVISLSFIIRAAYNIWFIGKFGATPGKMAVGVRVIRPGGEPVGYGRAAGRFFAEILSALILLIGYIIAAFDDEKRALHDRICDTRVIYKKQGQ